MKSKFILTSLFALFFSFSYAQLDIPPGGIPGFPPDNSNCPPGAWCHPNGAGMGITNDEIDDVNDALDDPDGCYGACTLGKWFSDLISPFYPDCYPNCNLDDDGDSSEGASTESHINDAPPFAARGKISAKTHDYFKTQLHKSLYRKDGKGVALEDMRGAKLKLGGMWVYNEKKKNEFHVLSIEPVDLKSGASYDRLYLTFTNNNMVILNQSWINSKKAKQRK